jgi:competence protein ComEC
MKKLTQFILVFLLVSGALVFTEISKKPTIAGVQIYFFDVGQGDAALIQEGDQQVLVDGGPDDKVLAELGKVMPAGDRKIEHVILTHPHADHITGLNQVLERYEVGEVISTGVISTSSQYLEFLDKIEKLKIPFKVPKVGDEISPFADSKIDFLWPGDSFLSKSIDNLNNSSEVFRFCTFDSCALFTGDMEVSEREDMIAYYTKENKLSELQAQIIKVAHHGSENGTGENLLENVKAIHAVISVGLNNQFGHPHEAALTLLKKYGLIIHRTDQNGTVRFILNKDGVFPE